MKISLFLKPFFIKAYMFVFLVVIVTSIPIRAHASFFSMISSVFTGSKQAQAEGVGSLLADGSIHNSQTMSLLESSVNPDIKNIKDKPSVTIVADNAIAPNDNAIGYGLEDISAGGITVYKVKKGDTLSQIAQDFDVSVNTIRWANNISGQKIRIGEKLDILPVTGVKHTVKRGNTLIGIANMYDANLNDILVFNGISKDDIIKKGEVLYIPNGIIKKRRSRRIYSSKTVSRKSSQRAPRGYFIIPVNGPITSPYGPRRGGFHYGIDIGAKRGTPVKAAASGRVMTVINYCKEGRITCGGGYGNFIIIKHPNGMMTRYAHLTVALVRVGQKVIQGHIIAKTGNTGHTTGPHIHFEEENSYGSKLRPRF